MLMIIDLENSQLGGGKLISLLFNKQKHHKTSVFVYFHSSNLLILSIFPTSVDSPYPPANYLSL